MKIALFGYGKMGKLVEKIALERGHTIAPILELADVCIDFSHHSVVLRNLEQAAKVGKNLVIGTTGWNDQLPQAKEIIAKYGVGCLIGSNFSMGALLFQQIVSAAAEMVNHYEEYDISGFECHHQQKVDAPSGTAKQLAAVLLKNIQRKKKVIYELNNRKIEPDELHFSSLRAGSHPGKHEIIFDSRADTITITHEARGREGFALGAVQGAEWIIDKKGFFHVEQIFNAEAS